DRAAQRPRRGTRRPAAPHRHPDGEAAARDGACLVSKGDSTRARRRALTEAVHGGEKRPRPGNAITTPIFQTATYVFRDTAELFDYRSGNVEGEESGRYGNPTQRIAEEKCAALEGAEAGVAFSSGMAAITTALLAIVQSGQHVILTDDCYRRTRQFCRT